MRMIGDKYWTTGITVKFLDTNRWKASVDFFDDGFCDDAATQGTLSTRYFVELGQALDTLIADVDRLGIEWRMKALYAFGDGNDAEWPMPAGWREMFEAQAERLGFEKGSALDLRSCMNW